MSKAEKIKAFDPDGPASVDAGIYGLPFTCEEADIVIVPVPWEVTTSYGEGTSEGPEAIAEASFQVDLFHPEFPELWKRGIAMDVIPEKIQQQSNVLKVSAELVIDVLVDGGDLKERNEAEKAVETVNEACTKMNDHVQQRTSHWLDQGKLVGLLGGDHSTPLGFIRALATRHESFGILHIDAHMDLRKAYEGFTYSHASIFYNVLPLEQVSKIVQVGIRDNCHAEENVVKKNSPRIIVQRSAELRAAQFQGTTWRKQCEFIVDQLPDKVYISFDIDGLDPSLCPNTGTPVPGGLQFEEATFLLSMLKEKGKQVIGFDMVEVTPADDEWDANVGARLLWYLCGIMAR